MIAGSHREGDVRGLRRVVDEHDGLARLGQLRLDDQLVAAVEWGVLAEGEGAGWLGAQ
jgi:hypothetical protein